MAGKSKGKRTLICLSSSPSSSSDSEEIEEDCDDSNDDCENQQSSDSNFSGDDDYSCDEDDGVSCDDDYDNDDNDNDNIDEEDYDDDESRSNRVVGLLKGGGDLETLSVKECKSYLRKHGLRISGTKAVCIRRILEHWRIKGGNSEAIYPRSSFTINCRGDVCKGDIVLFTQKVYEKFDKVTRHGKLLGKRTVAGRVVKESYGAAKQQHTFTVEVLWSKGVKKLPPLLPLLVKGRNLYKLNTFRQRWNNEAERINVLTEKHKRGTAARMARAMKKSKMTQSGNGGVKRQKNFHHSRPSKMRKTTERDKEKHFNVHGKTTAQRHGKLKNAMPRTSDILQNI